MSCRKIKSLLVDYYENSLPTEERKIIEDHLKACDDCRVHLKEIESLFKLLKEEKGKKMEENFWINFVPEIRGRIDEGPRPRLSWKPIPQLAPLLGMVMAILVVGVILFSRDYVFMTRGVPVINEIETYSLYDFENSSDQLVEILTQIGETEEMGDLISTDDKQSFLALEEMVDDQYWERAEWEEILEDLSLEELNLLEERIENIKI